MKTDPCPCPILYVDDSPDDHFLFKQAVLRAGTPLQVQSLYSGDLVIPYLQNLPAFTPRISSLYPMFLLCDYNLGYRKGSEVVACIRASEFSHALPIIMFSGFCEASTVSECYAAGANHFIVKPSSLERLKILILTLYQGATVEHGNFTSLKTLEEYVPVPHACLA